MSIQHVLAVVPVADFEAAHAWYERLFGRPADNLPMAGRLVEWRVTENGWVQVTFDQQLITGCRECCGLVRGATLAPPRLETAATDEQQPPPSLRGPWRARRAQRASHAQS